MQLDYIGKIFFSKEKKKGRKGEKNKEEIKAGIKL